MRALTDARNVDTLDELWLLEHEPVYTLGQAGKREHLLAPGSIPVVQSDRGGQVTYHGPGQLVAYTLVDLRRARLSIRAFVTLLEQCVIDLLADAGVSAARRNGAPGVYIEPAKVAALGLRARRSRTYHGVALNVSLSLAPFAGIDPCGYAGLAVTRTADQGIDFDLDEAGDRFTDAFVSQMGYAGVDEGCPAQRTRWWPGVQGGAQSGAAVQVAATSAADCIA